MLRRLALRSQFPVCTVSTRSAHFGSLAAAKRPLLIGTLLSEGAAGIQVVHDHAPAFSLLQKRCFAAAQPPESGETEDAEALKKETSALRKFYGLGTVLSTGLIGYGAWWGVNTTMKFVGAVYASPHIVAYVGFWAGFGTASLCAALAIGVYRLTFIRPEFAFSDTFAVVKNNDQVKSTLGKSIRKANLKTYEIQGGRFTAEGAVPKWNPHKIQMMYMIYGEKGMGLVTTVCVKQPSLIPRALEPNLLAIDFLDKDKINKDQETLVIVGDKSQLDVRDNIYRLLDIKLDFAMGKQK